MIYKNRLQINIYYNEENFFQSFVHKTYKTYVLVGCKKIIMKTKQKNP